MKGYVAQRRGRFYAVIYEGLDPVTGRERRTWHPAGTDRAAAERLASRLAEEEQGRADAVRDGGTPGERPEEDRLNPVEAPTKPKAQVL
jgi:hypothetical protein